MGKLRVAITGATGIIGSHVIFEFIKLFKADLNSLDLFILGRDKNGRSLKERILFLMEEGGVDYLNGINKEEIVNFLNSENNVRYINIELLKEGLRLGNESFLVLKKLGIDIFLHIAASTDLRGGSSSENLIQETNVEGTKRIINLISELKVGMFGYVGTAYVFDNKTDLIMPDGGRISKDLRNPYEKSKLLAEGIVRNFSRRTGVKCIFFRPSVVCGRLIESPTGYINSFNVFYSWFAFFWRVKLKRLGREKADKNDGVDIKLRICFNQDSGLNVVPVDYVAKVISRVSLNQTAQGSYHIVSEKAAPYSLLLDSLRYLGIHGIKHVEEKPKNLSSLEKIYYKIPGKIFTPYLLQDYRNFYVDNLREILRNENIACPVMNPGKFKQLLDYAQKYDFGIS